MKKHLDSILYIFPVMLYYIFEAIIVGFFITLLWKFVLCNILGNLSYIQIIVIYWIIKMLLFNVFNLIGGLTTMGYNEMENEINENYNEGITE